MGQRGDRTRAVTLGQPRHRKGTPTGVNLCQSCKLRKGIVQRGVTLLCKPCSKRSDKRMKGV